jgi:hypothetical protein
MNESRGAALQTALAYHQAWTSGDFELAMTHVAADIICHAPSGRFDGAEAFREFMGPFAQILTSSRLVAAFGDDETALVMYDTDTVPVKDAPGAECLTVTDGKIRHIRIIFDRLPFAAARRSAETG